MDKLRNYEVSFSGLKNGKHNFRFEIEEAFFTIFETEQEFSKPNLIADVLLDKHSTFLEFDINVHGEVELVCDITNEPFEHHLENSIRVLVKFGEEYDDSNEEVITIPMQDHAFNIAQLVYEAVVLSIPMKKLSPNVSEEDLELLEKFQEQESQEDIEEENEVDPRWEALRKLKDKN